LGLFELGLTFQSDLNTVNPSNLLDLSDTALQKSERDRALEWAQISNGCLLGWRNRGLICDRGLGNCTTCTRCSTIYG